MTQPDWDKLFQQRPDLRPPGYQETIEKIKLQPHRPKPKKKK